MQLLADIPELLDQNGSHAEIMIKYLVEIMINLVEIMIKFLVEK